MIIIHKVVLLQKCIKSCKAGRIESLVAVAKIISNQTSSQIGFRAVNH